jgi:hypothetical protein
MRPRSRSPFIVSAWLLCSTLAAAADPVKIEWNEDTLTLIEQQAGYGRMIRANDGHILCCFDKNGRVCVKASVDDGKTWASEPVIVASSTFGNVTNPELLKLRNGSVMCCFNERPGDGIHPFAILSCSSSDGGRTWSVPKRIYKADTKFENGCWEPAAIQLPEGEIQLYFANESPYRASDEQEITMLRSLDDGQTWKKPTTISFRGDHRDGMPVPLLLQDGPKGIVVVIEDNGLNGDFKPVIVYSSLPNKWRHGPVSGDSPCRWPALSVPLEPDVYAGAPYIRQMPSGETVLSFQCTEAGRRKPHMLVYVGNNWCRKFAGRSVPFEVDGDTSCLWNSLFVKSKDVITAVSGTTVRGVVGLWSIDGKLIRDSADGDGSEKRATEISSIWEHRVDGGPAAFHVFYSNGTINNPNGGATWAIRGKKLTMRWPNDQAEGGAWIDRCVLSSNGSSYSGTNQSGNKITGRLSQTLFAPTRQSKSKKP